MPPRLVGSGRALPARNTSARATGRGSLAVRGRGGYRTLGQRPKVRIQGGQRPPWTAYWMPAISLAICFLAWMLPWRAIMMRWAWGEPAPCMDSVR